MKITSDWSSATIKIIVQESILIAARCGQMTITELAIASGMIAHGIPAREMDDRLCMQRVKIYQQLYNVRKINKDIVDRMELPLMDPM